MTKGRGCLLAHTMGLGKTLQVIAFLITLASLPPEAYSTLDMPEHLNSKKLNRDFKRFMVVVPPSIVVNWANEFKKWTPKKCKDALGRIYLVNETSPYERMTTIRRWYCRGGVLLSKFLCLFFANGQSAIVNFVHWQAGVPKDSRMKNRSVLENGFSILEPIWSLPTRPT